MIYSGIDEAGLGPILGPYCATRVTLRSPKPLMEYLNPYQKKIFYVNDSKKVYQGVNGFKRLELNILSFYYLLNKTLPESIQNFIPTLKGEWYNDTLTIPIIANKEDIIEQAYSIDTLFNKLEINLIEIKRSAVTAHNFNKLLDIWHNKATVCQEIIKPLIQSSFNYNQDHTLIIDKQGGRKFYKEYLESSFNEHIDIKFEENNLSKYSCGDIDINFQAKADSSSFSVALASMFSKYMREIAMISFNNYWQKKIPSIKRTAGYYTDGIRFLKELESAGLKPKDTKSLIRKR